jgi:hypothetical protein
VRYLTTNKEMSEMLSYQDRRKFKLLHGGEYYEPSIELSECGVLRICAAGTCCEKPIRDWVKMSVDGYDENKFIEAMWQAIEWHFGPSDQITVRKKWMEIVNRKQLEKEGGPKETFEQGE